MIQVPLYKTLVALKVANVHDFQGFNQINIPRFGSLSAQTYTPGTPLSATNQAWSYDSIGISTYKHSTVYIDDTQKAIVNIDQWRALASEEAYQIGNKIDSFVFSKITGSNGFTFASVDSSTLGEGGSAHRPISAGSANIVNIFAAAKKILLQNNVEMMGDWCSIVTPLVLSRIDTKAATAGFQVADATLRNGYSGTWMGFELYVSNNLPSGKCSAVNTSISGGAVSATNCRALYFGRKKMIDVYMKAPLVSVRPVDDKIGSNYITYVLYGAGITLKNRSRGLNVPMDITTSGNSGG